MEGFLQRHEEKVTGVLHGFDRVLFRGSLIGVCNRDQFDIWLSSLHVLYKDFGIFVERLSARIKEFTEGLAKEEGRPYEYLPSSRESKEGKARSIMERDGIKEGLICVLSCVEPCQTFGISKNREQKKLVLKSMERKCQHFYFYFADKHFGLMHLRLQSWVPFTVQVCLNGREFLACRLDRAGIRYEKRDNCFTKIEDIEKAQSFLSELETKKWQKYLDVLARRCNPLLTHKRLSMRGYYWSISEGEYATDIMFKDTCALKQIYPSLVNHAIHNFGSREILRFLGRKVNCRFDGEVTSDVRQRPEGIRIKHRVEENSIKMYDKQGSVLRIETTINNPRRFRVWRKVTRKNQQPYGWVPMRKGIADISRRVEICLAANKRYLEALSVVGAPCQAATVLDPVSKPVVINNRKFRPLKPITPHEVEIFKVVARGEFKIEGFRNKDLRQALAPNSDANTSEKQRASARASRTLALLKAHKLIAKVPKTSSYRTTKKGEYVINTAINLRTCNLLKMAA